MARLLAQITITVAAQREDLANRAHKHPLAMLHPELLDPESLPEGTGFELLVPPSKRTAVHRARPIVFSPDSPLEQGGFELTVPSDRSVSNQGRQPFCNDDATGTSIRFEVKDTLGIGANKLRRHREQQVPDREA